MGVQYVLRIIGRTLPDRPLSSAWGMTEIRNKPGYFLLADNWHLASVAWSQCSRRGADHFWSFEIPVQVSCRGADLYARLAHDLR